MTEHVDAISMEKIHRRRCLRRWQTEDYCLAKYRENKITFETLAKHKQLGLQYVRFIRQQKH